MIGAGRARERDGEALHALLRYDSPESLCVRAVPYLQEGLARGEAVMAVVSAEVAQVLGSALGEDAAGVAWQAEDVSYGRLGVMFEGFRRFLGEQRAAGAAMRLLTQNDALSTEERMAAYLRFEAMANEVYRPYGHRWACLYDTRAHSTMLLRQASQVHPRLLEPGGREIPNADYLEPSAYLARSGPPPPPPPPAAVQLDLPVTGPDQVAVVRRLLRRWADLHGMGDHACDVVSAVSEAVTNGLQHGTPPVRVRAWTADRLARVQVHDRGLTPIPATAGYHRPARMLDRGDGLWVARQLADVVTTHTDRGGTTVTLDFPLTTRQ
jgi:anti-sigma regulatory factor (Ser/Thr protein kinase)